MKFLKKITKVFLLVLALVILLATIYYHYWRSKNTFDTFSLIHESKELLYSPLIWQDGQIGKQSIHKTAVFVKVKINNLADDFYLQIDTGTPKTVFYGKALLPYKKELQQLAYDKQGKPTFVNDVTIKIGNTQLQAKKIEVLPHMGKIAKDNFTVIGSLGFDIVVGRTLVLDFMNDKMAITSRPWNQISSNIQRVDAASVNRFPILIPAQFNKHKIRLFYDSGSSLFPILTSNKHLSKLESKLPITTQCCIQNWDNQLKVYSRKIKNMIQIGSLNMDINTIYSIDNMNIVDYFPDWFLFGITGNKLFDKKLIVIDNKNNLFAIGE